MDCDPSTRYIESEWAEEGFDFGDYAALEGGSNVIYGAGGYTRYVVRGSGEILLLAWSADGQPAKLRKAKAAGIAVWGH